MNNSRVAIGLPVYNGEHWLRITVDSILDQTFDKFVLLISDNASTDGTREICEAYCSSDHRVQYVRNEENVGVFRNYDLAFLRTQSEYFKWCAVGDKCASTFIEKAVKILDDNDDTVLVHSKATFLGDPLGNTDVMDAVLNLTDDSAASRYRQYLTNVRLNNVMYGLIRSDQLRSTALNKVFHSSDICMMAELALRGKFAEIPELLFFRRMQADTASALKSPAQIRKFFSNEPNSPTSLWHWKAATTFVSRLLVSPITLSQKLDLLRFLGKRLVWDRNDLLQDLKDFVRR